jgi:hypothetical protein
VPAGETHQQSGPVMLISDAEPAHIEEPKLRNRIVEILSLHQTGVEAATALSAFWAGLPIKGHWKFSWK